MCSVRLHHERVPVEMQSELTLENPRTKIALGQMFCKLLCTCSSRCKILHSLRCV